MAYGKTIELFLVEGDPDGFITAELSNWNGIAMKIPRIGIENFKYKRTDLNVPGVYFLFCKENDEDSVYIGESEDVLARLKQHIQDYKAGKEKYYWTTAVMLFGRDLNKASIRYLEHKFATMTCKANKFSLITKNTYKNTVVKESQIAVLEEFIDNSKILINVLGYKVLDDDATAVKNAQEIFYCTSNNSKANASGFVSTGGFTVLKGSVTADKFVPSCPKSNMDMKEELVKKGIIVNDVFEQNYEFASPSQAASIIKGSSQNGNTAWVTKNGVCLKDYLNSND